MRKTLTDRQRRFVAEYLIDLNAVQAAIRAGYSKTSARVNAFMILRRPGVMEDVQKAMDERARRTNISQDHVLEELAAIAFCDPAEIASAHLSCPADIERLPKRVRSTIAGWGWNARGDFMVKLHKKLPALEMLAKHLGLFIDRTSVRINGDLSLNTEPMAATQRWLESIIEDETTHKKGIIGNQRGQNNKDPS